MKRRSDSELGRTYPPGAAVVVEGETGDAMYVVQSGTVEAVKMMNGEEVQLEVIGPGGFFGEMALFQDQRRAATVRALDEARVLTIDKRTLLRRMKEDPLLGYQILVHLADRVRDLDDRLRAALATGERQ